MLGDEIETKLLPALLGCFQTLHGAEKQPQKEEEEPLRHATFGPGAAVFSAVSKAADLGMEAGADGPLPPTGLRGAYPWACLRVLQALILPVATRPSELFPRASDPPPSSSPLASLGLQPGARAPSAAGALSPAAATLHSHQLAEVSIPRALRIMCRLQPHVECVCLAELAFGGAGENNDGSGGDGDGSGRQAGGAVTPGFAFLHQEEKQRGQQQPQQRGRTHAGFASLSLLVRRIHDIMREGLLSRDPLARARASHLLASLHRLGCTPKVRGRAERRASSHVLASLHHLGCTPKVRGKDPR